MSDHYFSPTPHSPDRRSNKTLTLRGTTFDVQVASGTFSPGGLDRGTRVLLETAPPASPVGTLVDLGCGWGPITLALATGSPDATVFAVDINERARELTALNAAHHGLTHVTVIGPEEYPDDTPIDTLWSNPPIRIGKKALHELLTTWLHRLAPHGEAWLVVAKNLGAQSLTRWLAENHEGAFIAERIGRDKGFHVIRVRRSP
jgi:16S rRNA (guanine1207-N2)-methyltransferase